MDILEIEMRRRGRFRALEIQMLAFASVLTAEQAAAFREKIEAVVVNTGVMYDDPADALAVDREGMQIFRDALSASMQRALAQLPHAPPRSA